MTPAAPSRRAPLFTLAILLMLSIAPVRPGQAAALPTNARVVFLHHSTGWVVWSNGVANWFSAYNAAHGTSYNVTEIGYPFVPYPDNNYPYDYWNIWVNHAGTTPYMGNPTLELLTQQYAVIVFKHCFPVGQIYPNTGHPDVTSSDKTLENYQAQYAALKTKMRSFPNNRFVVWTGAAKLAIETTPEMAARARTWASWVKNTWDEPGDNIFVWDFYDLETDGGMYMNPAYGTVDSHPSNAFGATVAPLFGQRVVDVIHGTGDSGFAGVPAAEAAGLSFALESANPGRGPVRFRIGLPGESPVVLQLFDMAGRRVAHVDAGVLPAGDHVLAWDRPAGRTQPGVYFARLTTQAGSRSSRIVLLD